MPWREASPMDQRTQFIADHLVVSLFMWKFMAQLPSHYSMS
jgi:hypothetical protein